MGSGTVLVVEDHHLVRDVIARSLGAAGFIVIEAENATSARAFVDSTTIDAAVLDIALTGDMNGLQLGHWIRYRYRLLPLVFVTGLSDWEMPAEVPLDQSTRLLRKPFGAREIAEAVRTMLVPRFGMGTLSKAE